MFARVVISIFLIAVGVASPWLVKDWMDSKADEERTELTYGRVAGLSERVKSRFRGKEPVEAADDSDEAAWESGLDQEPYPIALRTMRKLQGILPSSMGSLGSANHPALTSPAKVPLETKLDPQTRSNLDSELKEAGLSLGSPLFVRLFKEENELETWIQNPVTKEFSLFKVYRITKRSGRLGPKTKEGDGQAPEGFYFVSRSRLRPHTRHHLGFDLGYPNDFDVSLGRSGSDMMIHGGDSAAGSYALSKPDMNELYLLADSSLANGQPFFRIHIFPFRMTDKRMEREWQKQSSAIDFWVNLKEGYDFFENVSLPPEVGVSSGKYTFHLYRS